MNERPKESPWHPFLMPLAVFGSALIFLPAIGLSLLYIALSTEESFHAPWPKSTAVIVVALVLSLLVGGVAWLVAAKDERPGAAGH